MTSRSANNLKNKNMDSLIEENELLKKKIAELEERLKNYNSTERYKKYYENEINAEKVKERNKNYLKKMQETNPEKLKELRHNAYLRRKERKLQAKHENNKDT
jgi:hypothetical protein